MYENSDNLKGINREELFARMVGELPWGGLKTFIQTNAQLLKQVTAGGHRMDPKRRQRAEKIVLREAEKAEYPEAMVNGLFAAWYPVHEELHKALEDYFHGDEYKAYREEHEIEEDQYILSPEKFEEYFSVDDLEEWRVLLCFSPLKFSDEQAAKVMDDGQGNTRLLARIKDLEEKTEQLEKREQQLIAEAERLRGECQSANAEAQEAKKANRQIRTEVEALNVRLERTSGENRKVNEQLVEAERAQKTFEDKLKQRLRTEGARLQNEVDRLQKELADWQVKYEDQRLQNKNLESGIAQANRERNLQRTQATEAKAEAKHLSSFADLILERIDWPKVGTSMKLTPRLRQQFNSLIRKLTYEEDRSLTIEGTLPEFWDSLMNLERELIGSIAQSNSQEVVTGDVEGYWRSLTDAFGDVQISLEARGVILKMLQEIFYQVLDMKDLEEAVVPMNRISP